MTAMGEDKKTTKLRYGIVDFERRKHPRFKIDLPVEYGRSALGIKEGKAVNASEGGLLLWLPERMDIGRLLDVKLFLSMEAALRTIEIQVRVVWTDLHVEEGEDYRTGVEFSAVSEGDLEVLKTFLRSLSA